MERSTCRALMRTQTVSMEDGGREMPRKIKTTSRVAAEEAKKRKKQHEDSDEAVVDGVEEV